VPTYTIRYVRAEEDPGRRWRRLKDMPLRRKLVLSLGTLAALTILVALLSFRANQAAGKKIQDTGDVYMPAALSSERAGSGIERMAADVQSYLTYSRPADRDGYNQAAAAMAADLAALNNLAPSFDAADRQRVDDLNRAYGRWSPLPDQLFAVRDSTGSQEPALSQYQAEALPLAKEMSAIAGQITTSQQVLAQGDLGLGESELGTLRWATLVAGIVAALFAVAMVFFLDENIGSPIVRLTASAEKVRGGDLAAQAVVESHDEIGILAETFNRMTRQLRRTLTQSRRERQRADDLLNVVIPIGLQLHAEKDFGRLLENIVVQAKAFCHATGGVLYLRSDSDHLQPIVMHDDETGASFGGGTDEPVPLDPIPLDDPMYSLTVRAAWFDTTVNVADAVPAAPPNYVSRALVEDADEQSTSFLAMPLKPSQGQVMGVLQLTGARDPDTGQIIPFDSHLQQMMDSYSLLAAGALESYLREQGLQDEVQQLRMEIDVVKRQQDVDEITESDFFQSLQAKVRAVRSRNAPAPQTDAQETGAASGQDLTPGTVRQSEQES
jgi:HAMP domain-containing protein